MALCSYDEIKAHIIGVLQDFLSTNDDVINLLGESIYDISRIVNSDGQVITSTPQEGQNVIIYEDETVVSNYKSEQQEILDYQIDQIINCMNTTCDSCSGDCYQGTEFTVAMISCVNCNSDINQEDNLVPSLEFNSSFCGDTLSPIDLDTVLMVLDQAYTQSLPISSLYTSFNTANTDTVLDTNIYELLPQSKTKLQRIKQFFKDYEELKYHSSQSYPTFNCDEISYCWTDADENIYATTHDIAVNNLEGSIIRLNEDASETNVSDYNPNHTLEWLRSDLDKFLSDIDYEPVTYGDTRPVYENRSTGYMKIRNLNQAIIIRNEGGSNIGIETWKTTGFTITMWVRFLDKTTTGTLFNYGNPLRDKDPAGFMLETFVLTPESGITPTGVPENFFGDSSTERFIRLVVREDTPTILDSHVGAGWSDGYNRMAGLADAKRMYTHTRVPIDLTEWYFIVASYDPVDVTEDTTITPGSGYLGNPDFWRGNITEGGTSTHHSGLGARCKVEIISRSELIRARGFKQE